MTIQLGWWLAPAAVTIALWIWASRNMEAGGSHWGGDIGNAMVAGAALVGTLASWVVYLGLRLALS